MEIADVRRRVTETIERARLAAQERRARNDAATSAFAMFRDGVAIPVCRQVASALKAAGYPFIVNTPGGSVQLVSERSSGDYIEVTLDTDGDTPRVVGRSKRTRGRRTVESEQPLRDCPIGELTEDDLLTFLLKELEPLVER